MFDESPNVDVHAPEVIAPIPEAVAPEHAVSTGSPSSTTVDQDAPTPMTSDQSASSVIIHTIVPPDHHVSEHNNKWTKDHPLENIIGALDRPVKLEGLELGAPHAWYDMLSSFPASMSSPKGILPMWRSPNWMKIKEESSRSSHYVDSSFELTARFADADHAGCQDTRRSTSGSMQLLGDRLVSWSSKRQKSDAISNTGSLNILPYQKALGHPVSFHSRNMLRTWGDQNYTLSNGYQWGHLHLNTWTGRIEYLYKSLGGKLSFTTVNLKQLADEVDENSGA
ncbi:retrovirus-related pol polyprotein from transposon TNT 1-94 [Tanacetum coccineum]